MTSLFGFHHLQCSLFSFKPRESRDSKAKGLETTIAMARFKIVVFSTVAISSVAIFYWLYRRKKRENCFVVQIKNDVVVSTKKNTRNLPLAGNSISERAIEVLVGRLRSGVEDVEELEHILQSLLKTTAFEAKKGFFLACDGINATANYLKVDDEKIKGLVLQIMNNMALHRESQEIIKNYIHQLAYIIGHDSRDDILVKTLQVLINLSVFDEHHEEVIKEMSSRWSVLLKSTSLTIKIHALKLLVNLSINSTNMELLYKRELLHKVGHFITPKAHPDLCLRSTTYIANVLSAIQRQQNTTLKDFMVSIPGIQENMRKLSRSEKEDIRFQANRALAFMT